MTLLLRDPYVCRDINEQHINTRYLKVNASAHRSADGSLHLHLHSSWSEEYLWQDHTLPCNVIATTSLAEAISGAQYAIHAVPVQHSRKFLESIAVRGHVQACLVSYHSFMWSLIKHALCTGATCRSSSL